MEEARANGIPMLLSDLPVHREQAGDIARFFDRFSAASLADALAATGPAPARDLARLAHAADTRVAAYARAFAGLVRTTAAAG